MGKIMEKAWGIAKSLSPGLLVSGAASMMKTTKGVSKESPEVQENFRYNTKSVIGYTAVAIIVGIAAYQIGSTVSNHFRTMDEINHEAAKATFGSRRREGAGEEIPDNGDDPDDNEPTEQNGSDFDDNSNVNLDDWQLVGKLIYKGDRLILYGTPGSGKSTLVLQLVIDISQGRKSNIMANDSNVYAPQHVIYYDGELDDMDYKGFLGTYDRSKLSNITFIKDFFFQKPEDWIRDAGKRIEKCDKEVVVVLDNLSSICPSMSSDMIRNLFLKHMKRLQKKAKKRGVIVTFIVIAHANKEQRLFGSSNQDNFCTALLRLERTGETISMLTVEKNRKYGEMWNKRFNLKHGTIDGHKGFENLGEVKQPKASESHNPDNKKDETFAKYVCVSRRLAEYEEQKTKGKWEKIEAEFGVTAQCYNNWKNKYGQLKFNEVGDVIQETSEEKES